jgi:preprotein translocase subunit SecG
MGAGVRGEIMQRRTILLLVLFGVLALFYASVTRKGVPTITAEQKTQTRMHNQLDEQVLGTVGPGQQTNDPGHETDGSAEESSEH